MDLEQREGRVHRFKGHAVRRNIATHYGFRIAASLVERYADPRQALFNLGATDRAAGRSDLVPYWIYPVAGGARIERHVPAFPLGRDVQRLQTAAENAVSRLPLTPFPVRAGAHPVVRLELAREVKRRLKADVTGDLSDGAWRALQQAAGVA